MQPSRYDVIIIGGSFAGLSAAMQVARSRRSVLIIDAGEPRNRFVTAAHGFIGQDGQPPKEILAKFKHELDAYKTVSFLAGTVIQAEGRQDTFTVITDTQEKFQGRRLILAFGLVDLLPEIPGLAQYWGKSVFHCPYCNAYEVAGQRFGVLATQSESLHQAIVLLEWSPEITLFTNNSLQLNDAERQELVELGIIIEAAPVKQLNGSSNALQSIQLKDDRIIEIDTIFTLSDTTPGSPVAEQLKCDIEAGSFGPIIKVDPVTKETTTPGVFAAGDITRSFHKVSLAVADGNLAGVFSHKSLVLP